MLSIVTGAFLCNNYYLFNDGQTIVGSEGDKLMNIKEMIRKIFGNILNNNLLTRSKTIFSFIILFAGVSFALSGWNSRSLLIYTFIFTALLLIANYWEGHILYRYIFSIAALILFYTLVQLYPIKLVHFERLVFYIPLIIAYLLPDIISTNILGIVLAQLFSTYFGKADSSTILSDIIGIVYASAALSISFHLFRKLNFERNKYLKASITDSLTGLYTLKYLLENSQKILDKNHRAAVLLIDLDHFKQINDTYGHLIGNKILIELSDLFKKELMNTNCIISRLGGDEFVIFIHDLSDNQVEKIIDRLYLSSKHKVYSIDPALPPLRISFTVGSAYSNEHKKLNIQELLNQADTNMYLNKFGEYKLAKKNLIPNVELSARCKQLLKTLEEKEAYTYIHSRYVAQYSAELAIALGFAKERVKEIYISGLIHDIGKLFIPNEILRKPERLTYEEYLVVKNHVNDGLNIVKDMNLSEVMLNGIKYHHEKFDGTGYPNRIDGNDTPIEGRIIQIADAFSAMTIKRIYRDSLSLENALGELKKNGGSQFDPSLVSVFIDLFKDKKSAV
ncbi:diguanylate cyclase domain protein [Clostridiales bacterium oral taxon 876 str. F0540]|nr:diguanylate cyclase domain protein [Clostridiales bacterium oral taxon 876 str. F0540]